MIRRHPWRLAAIAIAAITAALVWRAGAARRRQPAPATGPVGAGSPAVASGTVTDDVTDVSAPAAADPIAAPSEPVSAARVFVAADPTVDVEDAIEEPIAEAVEEPVADSVVTEPVVAEPAVALLDLERIGRDLAGVEAALRRLDDGTYWTDEVTGEPLAEALLVADPVARRNV